MIVTMELRELVRLAIVTKRRELAMQAKARIEAEGSQVSDAAFIAYCTPGIPDAAETWLRLVSPLRVFVLRTSDGQSEWYVVDVSGKSPRICGAYGTEAEAHGHAAKL